MTSHAQILYDYSLGPTRKEAISQLPTKYAFFENWSRTMSTWDQTISVFNSHTEVKSNIIYLKLDSLPKFIIENFAYSRLETFIGSLYEIGFRQVSSDTWVRSNGNVMVLYDNRGLPGEVHPSHEMVAFFSLYTDEDIHLP